MTTSLPMYTLEQVNKHSTEKDAWMVVEGYVHNLTDFLPDHPGGKEILLDYLGKDASEVFISEAVHSHSQTAFTMLARYRIGVLKGATVVDRTTENYQLSHLVDVSKPIIPQIPKLGKQYAPWIHSQYGLNKIIIFDSFLEAFTRWPWWYIFIMWSPFIIYMVNKCLESVSVFQTIVMFVVGMLFWSVVEYTLHRFVFHISTDTTMWNYFHFFAHGIHHLTPNDASRLTFPPTFSFVIALVLTQIPGTFIPVSTGIHSALAGLAFGFVLYDTAHYYFHHGDAPWLPMWLQKMKTYHLNHHYKDDNNNYGVTSPLFDWVFGTVSKIATK